MLTDRGKEGGHAVSARGYFDPSSIPQAQPSVRLVNRGTKKRSVSVTIYHLKSYYTNTLNLASTQETDPVERGANGLDGGELAMK
jgi:hypothetical protein